MPLKLDGYMTTKELQSYISKKYNRHWTRMYVYILKSKKLIKAEKLGHQNFYPVEDIDRYIATLTRESSPGK